MTKDPNQIRQDTAIEKAAGIIGKARKHELSQIEVKQLTSKIESIFLSTGLLEPSDEYGKAFFEFSREVSTPADLVKQADYVLESIPIIQEAIKNPAFKGGLNMVLRSKRERSLDFEERKRVKLILEALQSSAEKVKLSNLPKAKKRGAPQDSTRYTTIWFLANLYADWIGFSGPIEDLPYTADARFIKFLEVSFLAFQPSRPMSRASLSQAWKRCRETELNGR
ncbi:MAG: hypothetical protein P1V34_05805 [Alphaproteobacteria bacterium]|nr:hypothetical protein [Alphaproteobacteria bacterium]